MYHFSVTDPLKKNDKNCLQYCRGNHLSAHTYGKKSLDTAAMSGTDAMVYVWSLGKSMSLLILQSVYTSCKERRPTQAGVKVRQKEESASGPSGQEEGGRDQQLLGQRARTRGGGIVQRRGIPVRSMNTVHITRIL